MSEREKSLDEVIAASTTMVELIDNIERAGGIKDGEGNDQDLNEIRELLLITPETPLNEVKKLERAGPTLIKRGVTRTSGFRDKLLELFSKEVAARKQELGG
jgi:hypothetical protein